MSDFPELISDVILALCKQEDIIDAVFQITLRDENTAYCTWAGGV